MNKAKLAGLKHVYSFTLHQTMKNKANILSIFILFIVAVFTFPLQSLTGSSYTTPDSAISTVYLSDKSGFAVDTELIKKENSQFRHITFYDASSYDEQAIEDMIDSLGKKEVFIVINEFGSNGVCNIEAAASDDTLLLLSDIEGLLDTFSSYITNSRYEQLGLSQTSLISTLSNYNISTLTLSDYYERESSYSLDFDAGFAIQFIYSIAVMVLCLLASSFIIRCITEEKASKLIDFLMVSVSPLSLLLGKIFAIMTYIFFIIIVMGAGFLLSYFASRQFFGMESLMVLLDELNINISLMNVNISTLFIVLISLLIAFTTYSILSGIIGTCCSSTEDTEPAIILVMLIIMAGYLVSCISPAVSSPALCTFLAVCPVISVFCAPVMYVCGSISLAVLLISWGIQLVILILLSVFCAKIYRDLLLYKGTRVKLSQLFSFYKNSKKEGYSK